MGSVWLWVQMTENDVLMSLVLKSVRERPCQVIFFILLIIGDPLKCREDGVDEGHPFTVLCVFILKTKTFAFQSNFISLVVFADVFLIDRLDTIIS